MVDFNIVTVMGLTAGALCAVSTTPELILTMRRDAPISRWLILRNAALTTGNALWVLYALASAQLPILIFCGINAVLTGALTLRQTRLVAPITLPNHPRKKEESIDD